MVRSISAGVASVLFRGRNLGTVQVKLNWEGFCKN
jgi:hypothetical protein